jgi:biopolymer transport protein ExbD
MRYMRRSRRNRALIPEITLTPLIDTALTLLIIFMVTSPMLNNAIKVDLPKGNVKEDIGLQEDVTVHIDKKNNLFLNGQAIKRDQLISQLQKKVSHQKNKTVYVKADKDIHYGAVIELVDTIKMVGEIDRVALATKKFA